MKKSLSQKQVILIASTLFGMFFGAGNLIFPVHLGQLAGRNVIYAIISFCITAVSIPILGVAAIGNTHSKDLLMLSSKVSKWYGLAFTCLLYLTIGPLFAIPRCATTSFSVGLTFLTNENNYALIQLIFSLIFFILVLFFSLRPNGIMTWIGKIINPLFLAFFLFLVVIALVNPLAEIGSVEPTLAYQNNSLFNGFIEGYGTMDCIAGLAFGVVVVDIVKKLGVNEDEDIAKTIIEAGSYTALMMIIIYILSIVMGAQSRGLFEVSDNGGIALAQIANHYLGATGSIILAITITLACLKTAIGLVTSCSEMFVTIFPKVSYKTFAIIFSVFSFAIANVGLTSLISYSVPVLMLLYPLAIVLILLAMTDKYFDGSRYVYASVTFFTLIPAIFDFIKTLPFGIDMSFVSKFLPFFDLGFGWVIPALIGLAVGLLLKKKYS